MGLAFPQGASISFLVLGQMRQYIVDRIIRYPEVEQENLKQFILIILTKKSIKVIQGHCPSNLQKLIFLPGILAALKTSLLYLEKKAG